MATLYITEYLAPGLFLGDSFVALADPPNNEQVVTIGAGSLQSTALKSTTKFVRLHADVICSVAMGSNPTATAANRRMVAGQTEYVQIPDAGSWKFAVITNT